MGRKGSRIRSLGIPLIVTAGLIASLITAGPAWAPPKSITYNANGATSGVVPTGGTYNSGSNYTVLGNIGSPPLAKTNFTFAGWNTAANDSGTTYQPGSNYVVPNAATIFYARWRATLTYVGNGSTSGSVPVDSSSPYANGATVTVAGNTGALARIGYQFSSWNTAANGSGTTYAPAATFVITGNTSLYAQWTPTYTVVYNPNGASGGSAPVDASSPYATGSTVTVLSNSGSLVRTGSTFSNWNTAVDGSGTTYAPGSTFTITTNTDLHALWRSTVTYDANNATGGSVPVDSSSPYLIDSTVTVIGNTGSLVRTGYTFTGWNTAANGSGTTYVGGNSFSLLANTVLYAQWSLITRTLTYDGNGQSTGLPPSDPGSPYASGSTVTVLGNTGSLTKIGNDFLGWNTAANGSGTSYAPGATFTITTDTTLYARWGQAYTVTYNGNGKTGGSSPTIDPVSYEAGSTVTVLANTGSLVKTGNIFGNWNTAANGGGTQYAPGDTFTINANVILYAQWRASVTYDANGATGGSAPIDPSSTYLDGATVTVLGNTGALVRTGYVFAGWWNTAADGGGSVYSPGDSFAINASVVLYAQWTATFTLSYNANGADGGSVPLDGSSPYRSGSTVTVLGNTGLLTKTGFAFSTWNTAANGLGTTYTAGSTFVIAANTTLYAQWGAADTHTISYSANGATGGSVPVDASSPYLHGATVTVIGNTGGLTRLGFAFSNWNTTQTGIGTPYSAGDTLTLSTNMTLYAQWVGITYTVSYNSNGSMSGTVPVDSSSPYIAGATVTVLSNSGTLSRTGYQFSGWNTAADGSGTSYAPGATFAINANMTLYATWVAIFTVIYRSGGSTGGVVPVDASSPYATGSTVTVLANTGSLVRTGTTFDNWNTAVDGSGTSYDAGDTFTITSDTFLFAQWRSTLTYNANGATGGTVPVDGLSPYLTPYINSPTATVLGNTGTLVKLNANGIDYHAFAGWNTLADGTGTTYHAGDTFVISANTTLYAVWAPLASTVTYNANGATSGSVPIDATSPYSYGATVTVKANTGSLAKVGFTFLRWNTAANGTGTSYSPAATFAIAGNTVLYAQWIAVYTVRYDEDGATGGAAPNDGLSPYSSGSTVTVLGNTGGLVRTGNTFAGWNTVETGTGVQYAPGATFAITANTTLFAQWTVTVTYDPDGATGGSVPIDASSPYSNPYGAATVITVLSNPGNLVRSGYTFIHWGTEPSNAGEHLRAGDQYQISQNTILYAHWEILGTHNVVYNDNGATSGTVPSDSSNPYLAGSTAVVLGNTGSLAQEGYVFNGWNTNADGTGTAYRAGDSLILRAATVLYAQWVLPRFVLHYFGNGATGGTAPIDANSPYDGGDVVTVSSGYGTLSKTGYIFGGWNTAANGSGTTYSSQGSLTFTISQDTDLYAIWTPAPVQEVILPHATHHESVTIVVDNTGHAETAVEALVEQAAGWKAPVIVRVPGGVTPDGTSIVISPLITSAPGLTSSVNAVRVTAVDPSGVAIKRFDVPLEILLHRPSAPAVPMYSEDGVNWIPIPQVTGPELPEGMQEGFYVDPTGHTVILTRHLTYFGFRRYQAEIIVTPRVGAIEVGKSTRLIVRGGSGTGWRSFENLTPATCLVTPGGFVTGLAVGSCRVKAIKAADGTFLPKNSPEIVVSIDAAQQVSLWIEPIPYSIAVGQTFIPVIHGGSGLGQVTLASHDTTICSVNSEGRVLAVAEGSCQLTVVKAEDAKNLPAVSKPMSVYIRKTA